MQVKIEQLKQSVKIQFIESKAPSNIQAYLKANGFEYKPTPSGDCFKTKSMSYDSVLSVFESKAWVKKGLSGTKKRVKSVQTQKVKEEVLEGVPILSVKEQKALGITEDGLGKLSDPKVIDKINEMILKGIKESTAPWQNPLTHPFVPTRSFVAKRRYTGVNEIMLGYFGTSDKGYYITAKQLKELGGTLKKGASKDNNVFFYNRYYFDTVQNKFVPIEKHNPENENEELRMTLRNYEVYAVEDTDGIDHSHLPTLRVVREFSDIEQGEHFIKHLRKDAAKIIHKKTDKNSYRGGYIDIVEMSIKSDFISEEKYYKTLSHELVHSTGHYSRLNRVFGKKFGDKNYAKEELVAEIGASYLCSEIGILFSTIDNTSAYLKGWLGALQAELLKDKNLILKAMTQAYKAVEWLMEGIPKYVGTISEKETVSIDEVSKDLKKMSSKVKKLSDISKGKYTQNNKDLDQLHKIGLKHFSKDKSEFFKNLSKEKNIPVVLASAFSQKYNANGKNTPRKSSDLFWEDLKYWKSRVQLRISFLKQNLELTKEKLKLYIAKNKEWEVNLYSESVDKINKELYILESGNYNLSDYENGNDGATKTTFRKDKKILNPKQKKEKSLSGIPGTSTIAQLVEKPFVRFPISDKWTPVIGGFELPITILLTGKGGRGKSGMAMSFAEDFSKVKGQPKKVLFASKEQYFNPTFKHLIREVGIDENNPNLIFAPEYITKDYTPSMFDLVVIDSKDAFHLHDPKDVAKLQLEYPKTSFLILSQSTKDGLFTGAGQWQNVVDTMLDVYDIGKMRTGEKNRWGARGEITLFEAKNSTDETTI